jgi:hypothetical protein
MPFIYENGQSREVSQQEFIAFAKANGLPTPTLNSAQTGLTKDERAILQDEKAYSERQKEKIATATQQLKATDSQIELAKLNGASESELKQLLDDKERLEFRITNRQKNLAQSEAEIAKYEKIDASSSNPPGTDAIANTEDSNRAETLEQRSRLSEVAGQKATQTSAELQENSTVQTFSDGTSIQTFDDGSTVVTDSDGNTSSTPALADPKVNPKARREAAASGVLQSQGLLSAKQQASESAQLAAEQKQNELDEKKIELVTATDASEAAQQRLEQAQAALEQAQIDEDEDAIAAAQAELDDAQTAAEEAEVAALEAQIAADQAEEDAATAQDEANAAMQDVDDAQSELDAFEAELDDAGYSGDQDEDPTNESQTDQDTANKYSSSGNSPYDEAAINGLDLPDDYKPGSRAWENKDTPASAQWEGVKDMRVVLKVPESYLNSKYTNRLKDNDGILFPYTPTLSYESSASYGNANPMHSNYTQYFFKNSAVGSITLSGKFTVQNETEAKIWLSIVHLARTLTKMPFGTDKFRGSAPPVCRLNGYGEMVLANVPVAVTSFKFELPEGVDYIGVYNGEFINSMAPTISTISFTLVPMYSRDEIREFTVEGFLNGKYKGKGYL